MLTHYNFIQNIIYYIYISSFKYRHIINQFSLQIILELFQLMFQLNPSYLSIKEISALINTAQFSNLLNKVENHLQLNTNIINRCQQKPQSQNPFIAKNQDNQKIICKNDRLKIKKRINSNKKQKHNFEKKIIPHQILKKKKINRTQTADSRNQQQDYKIQIGEEYQAQIPEIRVTQSKIVRLKLKLYTPKTSPQNFQKIYTKIKTMLGENVTFSQMEMIHYLTQFDHDEDRIIDCISNRIEQIRIANKFKKTRIRL